MLLQQVMPLYNPWILKIPLWPQLRFPPETTLPERQTQKICTHATSARHLFPLADRQPQTHFSLDADQGKRKRFGVRLRALLSGRKDVGVSALECSMTVGWWLGLEPLFKWTAENQMTWPVHPISHPAVFKYFSGDQDSSWEAVETRKSKDTESQLTGPPEQCDPRLANTFFTCFSGQVHVLFHSFLNYLKNRLSDVLGLCTSNHRGET